jgi:hypothetical protein
MLERMAYQKIQVDPSTPDRVKRFIRDHLDMQFEDVHSMMTLPNCNFASAAVLLNLVSGISTILYEQTGGSRQRFKNLLRDFYPWDLQPATTATETTSISCLYDVIRNPLAHALGVSTKEVPAKKGKLKRIIFASSRHIISIGKSRWPEDLLEQLEQASTPQNPPCSKMRKAGKASTLAASTGAFGQCSPG